MVRVAAIAAFMQISVLWMNAVVGFDLEDQLQQMRTKYVRNHFIFM
jgi:hypothetical protein